MDGRMDEGRKGCRNVRRHVMFFFFVFFCMWCSYHNSWNVSDRDVLNQWFSRWGPRPIAHALRENLLEMQIWAPRPRSIESETLEVGPSTLCFNKSSRWFRPRLKFENHGGGPVSFYRWENQDEELGNDLSELTHSVCDTAGSPEFQPLPLPPNQPVSLHLAISLCNQKEPCICQAISKSWDWISTPVRFLISLGVFQNLEKKKKCDLELFLQGFEQWKGARRLHYSSLEAS